MLVQSLILELLVVRVVLFVKSMVQLTIMVFENAFSTKPQVRNIKVMQMLRNNIPGVILIKKAR